MATQLIEVPSSRPWPFQPQRPVKLIRSIKPEFFFLGSQPGVDLSRGAVWTRDSGAVHAFGAGGRGINFASSGGPGLSRAGHSTTAMTRVTFGALYIRNNSNDFAEVCGFSSNGTGFGLNFDGGGTAVGIQKNGVIALTNIAPAAGKLVFLLASHDQASGAYWIMASDLTGDALVRATQTETSVSSAPNGTVTINRNGGANTFQGTIFMAFGAAQYFPEAWGLKYIRRPWSLIEPISTSVWVPQEVGGSAIVGPLVGSRRLASNGPLVSGRLAA